MKYLLTIILLFFINILIAQKIIPIISWPALSSITYGTPISLTQLTATANVPGNFIYNPTVGDILGAGEQVLSVNFIPDDTLTYQSLKSITNKIIINKAAATLSFNNLNQRYDGTGKTVSVTTSPENIEVSILYNNSTVVPILTGNYVVTATINNGNYSANKITDTLKIVAVSGNIKISNLSQQYEPGVTKPVRVITNPIGLSVFTTYNGSSTPPINPGSYQVISTIQDSGYQGSDTETLVINKSVPNINWNNPLSIVYGTRLTSTQLNYTSNADGQWFNDNLLGKIFNVGLHVLSVKLVPYDNNFLTAYKTVYIIVNKFNVNLSVSNLSQNYNGFKKEVQVTPANIYGTKTTYSGLDSAVVSGSYSTITTLINDNFSSFSVSKTLIINKGNPVITWPTIKPVNYGSIFSGYQLNAKSSVNGIFSYFPTFGTFIQPGNTTIYTTFIPTDHNYNTAAASNVITSTSNSEYPQYFNSRTIKLY